MKRFYGWLLVAMVVLGCIVAFTAGHKSDTWTVQYKTEAGTVVVQSGETTLEAIDTMPAKTKSGVQVYLEPTSDGEGWKVSGVKEQR